MQSQGAKAACLCVVMRSKMISALGKLRGKWAQGGGRRFSPSPGSEQHNSKEVDLFTRHRPHLPCLIPWTIVSLVLVNPRRGSFPPGPAEIRV